MLFTKHPPLDRDQAGVLLPGRPDTKIADVKVGLQTSDDDRFVRFWWEVAPAQTGRDRRWVPFAKGGTHVRFYSRIDLLVNWDRDGKEIQDSTRAVVRNPRFYFSPGVTWPPASWRIRRFGIFPEDHIFGHKGCSIFPVAAAASTVAGLLNSSVGTIAMLMQTPERMWEVGMVAAVPITQEALTAPRLAELTAALVRHRQAAHAGDETCRDFRAPDLLDIFTAHREAPDAGCDLAALLGIWLRARRQAADDEVRLIRELDREVYRLYKISDGDQRLIDDELARRPRAEGGYTPGERPGVAAVPGEPSAPEDEESPKAHDEEVTEPVDQGEGAEPVDDRGEREEVPATIEPRCARDLVARWLSYYLKQAIEADEDGIVAVDPAHGQPALVVRLTDRVRTELGRNRADVLEHQAPAYLGTKDLAEWIAISREETIQNGAKAERVPVGFFPWHVSLYQNRPIFWLLSSENFEPGKTRLTFRVYLDYLKLTPDTLSRVVSHYLESSIKTANSEWQRAREGAARVVGRATGGGRQAADEWANTVMALGRFRAAVEGVIQGPAQAQQVPANAKWLPRAIAQVRGGIDVGHGYQPDVDFGVRVNIAPLVEARLLPRVVLKRLGG